MGECEIQLREHYHINENDSLIIVKSEKKSDKVLDKNIYSVEFHYLKCSCSESSNNESKLFERKVKLESKKMYERFYEVLKYLNVKIIKCYNILLI